MLRREWKKNNTMSPNLNILNNSNVQRTNKASKTSKCKSKKYSTTLTFWDFSTQNEETTSETEYTTTANMEDTTPATTEPQPMEMDTLIS